MVAVTMWGVVLPEGNDLPARALSVDDLILLQKVAAEGAHAIAGMGESAQSLLDDLNARGLLTARPAPASEGAPSSGEAAVPERDPGLEEHFILVSPVVLRLHAAGFEHLARDGQVLLRLTAVELHAATEFRTEISARAAWRQHVERAGAERLDEVAFVRLLRRLVGGELLQRLDPGGSSRQHALSRWDRDIRVATERERRLTEAVGRELAAHDAGERTRRARTGVTRPRVVPIHFQWRITPLALGMIVAYAKRYEGGRLDDFYEFSPTWLGDGVRVPGPGGPPAIYLFSHYIWSSADNLALSAKLSASAASPWAAVASPSPRTAMSTCGWARK